MDEVYLKIIGMYQFWHILTYSWCALAVITFVFLFYLRVTPPFGRHTRTDWGPMINNSFGWFIMEIPSLLCLWLSFLYFRTESTPTLAWLAMALWTAHYINRAFIFPVRLRDKTKKMPLVITFSSIFFNLINGSVNGTFLAKGWFIESPVLVVAGLAIFAVGMYINLKSDHILINLRKPGDKGYYIPKGFLFDRISTPNLFGEMIEWFGFFLVAPGWGSFSFFIWTLANLLPRARDHHEWYLEKFSDYPKDRKICVPGIW